MQIIPISYPIDFDTPRVFVGEQVVAIGDFDGVHMGHREVVDEPYLLPKSLIFQRQS